MNRYTKLSPEADDYMTKLTTNYRSHESLIELPNRLFYPESHFQLNANKRPWQHKGPTGYSFVCSDSRLVPDYISKDHPLVEACVVLEQVLDYLKKMKEVNPRFNSHNVCVIASTRKQVSLLSKDLLIFFISVEPN